MTKEVVIRTGILGYALSLCVVVFGVFLLYIPLQAPSQPTSEPLSLTENLLTVLVLAAFLAAGIASLWCTSMIIKQRYTVSLKGVDVKRLRKSRFVAWEDVIAFAEIPTMYGTGIYVIELVDRSKVMFYIPFMANPERSARALIEAAHIANPEIKFNFFLGNEYGKPPYGIFRSKT